MTSRAEFAEMKRLFRIEIAEHCDYTCQICSRSPLSLSLDQKTDDDGLIIVRTGEGERSLTNRSIVCKFCCGRMGNMSFEEAKKVYAETRWKKPEKHFDSEAFAAFKARITEIAIERNYKNFAISEIGIQKFRGIYFNQIEEVAQRFMNSPLRNAPYFQWKDKSLTRNHSQLRRLLGEQNHKCCYCGIRMTTNDGHAPDAATIEHVINRSDGGAAGVENCVIACANCNSLRNTLRISAIDYFYWLQDNRDQWQEYFTLMKSKIKKSIKRRIYSYE